MGSVGGGTRAMRLTSVLIFVTVVIPEMSAAPTNCKIWLHHLAGEVGLMFSKSVLMLATLVLVDVGRLHQPGNVLKPSLRQSMQVKPTLALIYLHEPSQIHSFDASTASKHRVRIVNPRKWRGNSRTCHPSLTLAQLVGRACHEWLQDPHRC